MGCQALGLYYRQAPRPYFTRPEGTVPGVQQTLDAVVERLLLLNRVVEHLGKAGEGARSRVFKNARFLNTSISHSPEVLIVGGTLVAPGFVH